jgi:hypothetical protein
MKLEGFYQAIAHQLKGILEKARSNVNCDGVF